MHLENARLLLDWSDTPLLQQYYEPQPVPTPNTISHLLLGGLPSLFPAAAWLIFPFVLGYPFHLGFYGFCYSTALLLVLLSSWLHRRSEPERTDILVLALLFLLTYVAHPIPFLVAVGVIGLGEVFFAVARWRREDRLSASGSIRVGLAAVPSLLVLALFGSGQQIERLSWIPWDLRWRSVVILDAIVSFRPEEWVLSGLLALVVSAGAAWSLWQWRRLSGAVRLDLAGGVLLLLLGLIVPNSVVGSRSIMIAGWLSFRAAFLGWLLLALGVGTMVVGQPWGRRIVPGVGLAVFAGFLGLHVGSYRQLGPLLEEQASLAEDLPKESVFLPVTVAARGTRTDAPSLSTKVRPSLHGFSRGAATAVPRIDVGNYQARPGTFFPYVYRRELDPTRYPRMRPVQEAPAFLDPRAYDRGPGRIDFILVWGAPNDPATQALHAWLEDAGYALAAESLPGNARAYRAAGQRPGRPRANIEPGSFKPKVHGVPSGRRSAPGPKSRRPRAGSPPGNPEASRGGSRRRLAASPIRSPRPVRIGLGEDGDQCQELGDQEEPEEPSHFRRAVMVSGAPRTRGRAGRGGSGRRRAPGPEPGDHAAE